MAASRSRDAGGSFAARRGHASQLSITDPSHHVTEAIGTLYGDDEDDAPDEGRLDGVRPLDGGRPMSYVCGPAYQDQIHRPLPHPETHLSDGRRHLLRANSDQPHSSSLGADSLHERRAQTLPIRAISQRSDLGPKSPTPLSLKDVQAGSGSQFPLTNIENPNDIAQELSNLQALRRLSMDVGNSIDPDLPPMCLTAMPPIAPTGDDDEGDPSRLLWVPARVHPELAPSEFRSFLEKRVHSIKRRSGESLLSADGNFSRRDASALRRKKSTLSHQIDNTRERPSENYVDGAEILQRKRSKDARRHAELTLDDLVNDPAAAVQKFAQESQESAGHGSSSDDMPILPMAPGMGLRRSTRTTYRKGGSLRSGDRAPFARRVAQRQLDGEPTEQDARSSLDAPKGHGLARVHTEPVAENYSRPTRSVHRHNRFEHGSAGGTLASVGGSDQVSFGDEGEPFNHHPRQDQISVRGPSPTRPSIDMADNNDAGDGGDPPHPRVFPQRSSSQNQPLLNTNQPDLGTSDPPLRSSRRKPGILNESQASSAPPGNSLQQRQQQDQVDPQRTLQQQLDSQNSGQQPGTEQQHLAQYQTDHHQQEQFQQQRSRDSRPSSSPANTVNDTLGAHPSPLPGGGATRTDSLTFIPTLSPDDKKSEKKSKKEKDDDSSSISSSRSGSAWKWFKGSADDKEKRKDDGKKSRARTLVEKAQDNVRLDVIQSSIDRTGSKGRDNVAPERDSLENRLQEERKKENNRKSDSKREKDGSIFSSIFGGSKRKEEKEKASKRTQHLQVPEDPPYRALQPDVDFHWTRFPLLEERAIYRMAHIKLANPRRPLLSQVLLSNFMYSYLAIVQAMHPQMNVPVSPQQKRIEEEARRKQEQEEYDAARQEEHDADNSLEQYDFDYRAAVQYTDRTSSEPVDYVDDAQIYQDEHWDEQEHQYDYDGSEGYGHDVKDYYHYEDNTNNRRHNGNGRDDMW